MKGKIHFFSVIVGLVVGIVIMGLILGFIIMSRNDTIKLKEKEIVDLQRVISDKNLEVSALQGTINQKKQELEKVQGEISEVAKHMAYMKQPDLPVKISIRNAFTTNTKVLRLTNYSGNALRVHISSSIEGRTQSRVLELVPNQLQELGQKEGFPFKPGDSVALEAKGYRGRIINIR